MKILKILGIVIVLIILAGVILVYTLPDTAHMERSITINRAPQNVYNELISYRNFDEWSPWSEKDPELEIQLSGPPYGIGARYQWSGNEDVGQGSMEIIDLMENEKVVNVMDFGFGTRPIATYRLEEAEEGTLLTWSYDEKDISGVSKLFMLGIDGFLGPDYEKGLQGLKERLETSPEFSTEISLTRTESYNFLGISDRSSNDPNILASKMAQAYGKLMNFMSQNKIEMQGTPMAVYDSFDKEEIAFICGMPIKGEVETQDEIEMRRSYSGAVIKSSYYGEYSGLEAAYDDLKNFADFYSYRQNGNPWEQYITDPSSEPDTTMWLTEVYFPIK